MTDSFSLLESTWESPRHLAEWDHAKMTDSDEMVDCPVNPDHRHNGKRVKDLCVVLPEVDVQDFVWTWQSECLIQDRVLQLFRDHGFTGFEVKPVEARFVKSTRKPPKLWELIVTGWAGIAKPESGIQLNEAKSCKACGNLEYSGLVNPQELIDKNTWDGSDFFIVWPMTKFIFITDRVVNFVRKSKLVGGIIVPLSEMKKTGDLSPNLLRYNRMPDERSRQIGEPLGLY